MCDRDQGWGWPSSCRSPSPPPRRDNTANSSRQAQNSQAARNQDYRSRQYPRAPGSIRSVQDSRSIDQDYRPAQRPSAPESTRSIRDTRSLRDQDYRSAPRPKAPAPRMGVQDAQTIRDVGDRPPAAPATQAGGDSNFRGDGHRLIYSNSEEEFLNLPGIRELKDSIRRDLDSGRRTTDGRSRDRSIDDHNRRRDTRERPPQQAHASSVSGWSRAESRPRRPTQSRYVAPPRSPEPPRRSKRTPSHSSDCTVISDDDYYIDGPPSAAEIEYHRRRNAEIRAQIPEWAAFEKSLADAEDCDCDCPDCR